MHKTKLFSITKRFQIILCSLFFFILFSFSSFAADIHKLPAQYVGLRTLDDAFPYGFIKLYEEHFAGVPDFLVEYFAKRGGTVTFTTQNINHGIPAKNNIMGFYHPETQNIEIKLRTFEIMEQDTKFYETPAHEFGHFLQEVTKDVWTEDMMTALHQDFVKRSKTDSTITNEKEAFANAYADYVYAPWTVDPAMQKVIKKCLDQVFILNGGLALYS